jgi:hypothetical protein
MIMLEQNTKTKSQILGLTVHQPWADLISDGYKHIENRSWRPPDHLIGHFIAIHAGKVYDPLAAIIVRQRFGIPVKCDPEIQLGAIVAVARLEAIVTDSEDPWFYGPYGWVLRDITSIEAVPCRGAQRLWSLPRETLHQVRANFKKAAVAPEVEASRLQVSHSA